VENVEYEDDKLMNIEEMKRRQEEEEKEQLLLIRQ